MPTEDGPPEGPQKIELVKDYPKQIFPDPPVRPPEYLAYLEKATDALKSLRLVVYAGLSAFILLAAYGFFLIYLLTSDARTMAEQARRMAEQMELMSREMTGMSVTMGDMRANMTEMQTSLSEMNRLMASVDRSTGHMADAVTLIQHSARNLDTSFGPAMGAMNRFMPFGAGGNTWPGAPPFMPPPR